MCSWESSGSLENSVSWESSGSLENSVSWGYSYSWENSNFWEIVTIGKMVALWEIVTLGIIVLENSDSWENIDSWENGGSWGNSDMRGNSRTFLALLVEQITAAYFDATFSQMMQLFPAMAIAANLKNIYPCTSFDCV